MFSSENCHNWRDRLPPPRLGPMPPPEIQSPRPAARFFAAPVLSVFLALAAGIVTPASAQGQGASDEQKCLGESAVEADKRIEICSALIAKAGQRKEDLLGFYLARGDAQREKRQFDAALNDYGQALKLDSAHTDALNRRGLTYVQRGDRDRALADFDRAIRADPKHVESYNNRGGLLRDRGMADRALADFEKALQLDPKFAPAWDALGLRYYYDATYAGGGVEAFDKAANAYETALKLDPNLITSVAHLVRIRAERGQTADAYREARDLISRRPENAQAHFTMAYVLRYAGMLSESVRECDAALALDPTNYDFRSCSFGFFELGRTSRALEYVHLDSGSEWAASVLPAILLREGRMDEARAMAVKITPGATWFAPILQACVKPAALVDMKRIADQYATQLLGLRDAELRYYHGAILSYCGQPELAAKLIQSAISARYCAGTALTTDPLLEKLRATPLFPPLQQAAQQCQNEFLKATK